MTNRALSLRLVSACFLLLAASVTTACSGGVDDERAGSDRGALTGTADPRSGDQAAPNAPLNAASTDAMEGELRHSAAATRATLKNDAWRVSSTHASGDAGTATVAPSNDDFNHVDPESDLHGGKSRRPGAATDAGDAKSDGDAGAPEQSSASEPSDDFNHQDPESDPESPLHRHHADAGTTQDDDRDHASRFELSIGRRCVSETCGHEL